MTDDRTHGQRVRASILAEGVALWRDGADCVTARAIARRLDMTHSAVLYHFDNADAMKAAIAAEAVRLGDAAVVPVLIATRHPAAAAISEADRRRFLAGC